MDPRKFHFLLLGPVERRRFRGQRDPEVGVKPSDGEPAAAFEPSAGSHLPSAASHRPSLGREWSTQGASRGVRGRTWERGKPEGPSPFSVATPAWHSGSCFGAEGKPPCSSSMHRLRDVGLLARVAAREARPNRVEPRGSPSEGRKARRLDARENLRPVRRGQGLRAFLLVKSTGSAPHRMTDAVPADASRR